MFLQLSVILFTGGGSDSVHAGIPHPPGTRHPRDQTPPPQDQVPPSGPGTPSPCQQTATVADGTHPTGMHSCLFIFIPTKGQERVCERQVVFLHAREKISRTNSITIILFRNVFLKTCFCWITKFTVLAVWAYKLLVTLDWLDQIIMKALKWVNVTEIVI